MFKPTDHPLHRRRFLQQASIFAIGAAFGDSISGSASAQDATTSIATRLGTSIANGFGKQVATLAFGQIMSAIGIDTGGAAAIQAELDQILTALQVLQGTVEAMKSELEVGLAKLDFSGALAPVLPLVAANEDLAQSLRVLVSLSPTPSDSANEKASKITEIEVQKRLIGRKITAAYESGLPSWNNAIQGLHGQPSLIKTWSTLVAENSGAFFGWEDAQKVQSQWDFFDAHQALTASFLVDYCNGLGAHSQARATLMEWYRGRRQQLALLRGVTQRTDSFTVSDGYSGRQTEITDLSYLPEKTLIHKATGLMWYLEALGEVVPFPQVTSDRSFLNIKFDPAQVTGRPRYHAGYRRDPDLGNNQPPEQPSYTDPGPWLIPDNGEFRALVGACGGALHTDNDHFMSEMRKKGFVFPSARVGVFLRSGVFRHGEGGFPPYGYYPDMYREDTNALDGADWNDCCTATFGRGWGGTGRVVLFRRAIGDEAYWYSP